MRAKSFFYACLGVLALALAYHLGARSAVAQGASAVLSVEASGGASSSSYAIGRTVGYMSDGGSAGTASSPVPGDSPIAATAASGGGLLAVVLENGDYYWTTTNGMPPQTSWVYVGNVLGSATPAQRESMGQLKVRYR